MAVVVGDRARPWVLTLGIDRESEIGHFLTEKFETIRFLESDLDFLTSVRQSDFDILVVTGSVPQDPDAKLNVIQFGHQLTGETESGVSGSRRIGATYDGTAGRLTGPDENAPHNITDLAVESLAPWLLENPLHPVLSILDRNIGTQDATGIVAVVRELGGMPCAGYWTRAAGGGSEWWWLPTECPDETKWIAAIIEHLAGNDPQAFPGLAESQWDSSPAWMTAAELQAQIELTTAREEQARVQADQEALVSAKELNLAGKREAVSAGLRRLLTAQGDDLKSAAATALAPGSDF